MRRGLSTSLRNTSWSRRMGGAKRYPSTSVRVMMGFASLYPSYADMTSRSRGADPPEVCITPFALLEIRGRREDRVLAAPAVSRAICANKRAHEHTGQREHSGLPCAMALRLTPCYSRRTALLPPSLRGNCTSRGLSASTAAPEPHDFAVRSSTTSSRSSRVHRISPRVRDDGQRPSSAVRKAELCGLIYLTA